MDAGLRSTPQDPRSAIHSVLHTGYYSDSLFEFEPEIWAKLSSSKVCGLRGGGIELPFTTDIEK